MFVVMEIRNFNSRKTEGCIPSGLGAKSSFGQASYLADENLVVKGFYDLSFNKYFGAKSLLIIFAKRDHLTDLFHYESCATVHCRFFSMHH